MFSFVCRVVSGTLKINEESDAFEYFSYKKIPKKFPPTHRTRVKDALDNPNKLVMKIQNEPSVRELIEQGML